MFYQKYIKYKEKIQLLKGGGDDDDNEANIPLIIKVPTELTTKEKETITSIKIETPVHTDFFYDENTIQDKILDYINKIGENNNIAEDTTNIIKRIIEGVIRHEKEESAIISLRATAYHKNDSKFRWHRDGKHISFPVSKPVYKYTLALKGESTPLVIDKNAIDKFDAIDNDKQELQDCMWKFAGKYKLGPYDIPIEYFKGIDKMTAPLLVDAIGNDYVQTRTLEEGVYFLTMKDGTSKREKNTGAIHSEPEIQKDRLFLVVLPGLQDECRKYIEKNSRK